MTASGCRWSRPSDSKWPAPPARSCARQWCAAYPGDGPATSSGRSGSSATQGTARAARGGRGGVGTRGRRDLTAGRAAAPAGHAARLRSGRAGIGARPAHRRVEAERRGTPDNCSSSPASPGSERPGWSPSCSSTVVASGGIVLAGRSDEDLTAPYGPVAHALTLAGDGGGPRGPTWLSGPASWCASSPSWRAAPPAPWPTPYGRTTRRTPPSSTSPSGPGWRPRPASPPYCWSSTICTGPTPPPSSSSARCSTWSPPSVSSSSAPTATPTST